MVNLLLQAVTHILGANNWDKLVVSETLCILRRKGVINENYKILTTNATNVLSSENELLKTSPFSSTDDALSNPSLVLFQKLQFSTSNSTIVLTVTSSHSKKTLIITNMI